MSGIELRTLRARRGLLCLLAALCLFLTSGAAPAPVVAPGAEPAQAKPHEDPAAAREGRVARRMADSLRLINPSLTPRERMRIGAAIERYSGQYELDPDLVLAVMLVESNARPWAYSAKGAVGLMQVMPHMMKPMGLAGNLATIESNIEAGCFILAHNIRRLGVEDGISAYFWGSDIRGVAYLEKVLEARERVRELAPS